MKIASKREIHIQLVRDRINIAIEYLGLIAKEPRDAGKNAIRAQNGKINLQRALDALARVSP